MPVLNGELYLAEALQGIVDQTYPEKEIVVVDDGSTDRTAELVKGSFPTAKYRFQENAGTGAARNAAIAVSTGKLLAFLDADDVYVKEKLTLQVAAFRKNPDTDIVFGHVKQFHSPELDEVTKRSVQCAAEAMPGTLPCTMLIGREASLRVGLFETKWRVGQDVSWMIRAKERGLQTLTLTDIVYLRRLHKSNKGITQRAFMKDRVRILKESLDRRRDNSRG
ncbi:MAG: glycosyltransferase family A protein [Chloroflexi bacterium]|nr:glycosyltransferase family A protein [Chloroflexota bacterium]